MRKERRLGRALSLALLLATLSALGIARISLADEDANDIGEASSILIRQADLRTWITALAADDMKGRAPETGGLDKAADYLIGEMKRLGFQPGGDHQTYEQKFTMAARSWQDADSSVIRSGDKEAKLKSVWRPIALADGVWKGTAIKLGTDAKAKDFEDLAGKIVVVPEFGTVPNRAARAQIQEMAQNAKASALIFVAPSAEDSELRRLSFNFRRPTIIENIVKPPQMAVLRAAPELLTQLLGENVAESWLDQDAQAETMTADSPEWEIRLSAQTENHMTVRNLCGMIPGTDPNLKKQIVMLTAHYDHIGVNTRVKEGEGDNIFNGADDDASGVGSILAIGQAFMKHPPKRSVAVVALTLEERGIVGSSYMAEHPLFPFADVVADINIEMVGRVSAKGKGKFWVTGYERSSFGPIFQEAAQAVGAEAYADPYVAQSFFSRSDNISFARKGIPAHSCSTFDPGTHRDYHGVDDETDRLDFDNLEAVCRGIFAGADAIASGRKTPEWVEGKKP